MLAISLADNIRVDSEWIGLHTSLEPRVANGIPLRIMALGASVTRGDLSNGTVGFRKPLRDKLVSVGNMVNMVGSARVGQMKDNEVEAHQGNRVDQVHLWASHSVPWSKPNLFIVHVGSNDCFQGWDLENYYQRLHDFIIYLLHESPRATVMMSTLLTNTMPGTENCILYINDQIRWVYVTLRAQGKPVVMAEMHSLYAPDGDELPRPQPGNITPDGTHPDDEGYGMMAKIFFQAIREADRKGFFQTAEDIGIAADGNAERDAEDSRVSPPQASGTGRPSYDWQHQ